jgi:hypothetical protein
VQSFNEEKLRMEKRSMNIKFYQMRIDTIADAAKRSRWVFVATSIASIAIIGSTWNAYPSGLYDLAMYLWEGGFSANEPTQELQKALLKSWVDTLFVNVPLVGIKFSITDAWLLGSTTLLILAIWEFYALRRENHLIGWLLRDAQTETARVRSHIFHGVCGTQVFATLTENDEPVQDLYGKEVKTVPAIRMAWTMLLYLPVAAIIFIVFTDIASIVWWNAVFRSPHIPLLDVAKEIASKTGNRVLISFMFWNVVQEVVALCIGFPTLFLLWRVNCYQNGTIALLRKVSEENWGAIEPGDGPVQY